VAGGELFDFIVSHGKFSEPEARYFFQQIVSAISYCHRRKVAHRDLKPENLLLDSKTRTIKIADFGLSNIIDDGELLQTACGSPNYAAPEVISGLQYSGPEADVWSCGVILYALLTARLPFDDNYLPHLFKKIKEGKFIMPTYLSEDAKDLIGKILVVNPVDRLTMQEIRSHVWFKENLPRYLEISAESPEEGKFEINDRLVNEVAMRMKVSHSQIIEDIEKSLETGVAGPYYVAYQLVADALQLTKELKEKENKENGPMKEKSSLVSLSLVEMSSSPAINLRRELPFYEDNESTLNIVNAMDAGRRESQEPTKKFWYLGFMSTHQPMEIMEEVLKTLKKYDFEWKICGPSQLRCQHVVGSTQGPQLKIGIQLFSMPHKKQKAVYLLDIKVIQGQMFDFFFFCTKLFSELKHMNTK